MESNNFHVRKLACELLTVICYADTPRGHQRVVQAFETMKKAGTSIERLFQRWMMALDEAIECKEQIGGGRGGLIAGVGWLGENRVTDKDVFDYLVQ
jgi:hypothetical protein